ncbi:DNA lesion error-prone repair protein ImuA [Pseudomonas sp. PA15(2017)]|uniref:translesion DNA synthesis-associated protein ImuA n=1 Tax=Pseudomonas sp. PA15(2017) TaxID=1932111 RepID=UPI00095FF158|nr:translesion DNA synthesis-associated protein ImuA [Pseudomonas sp. PA15(2017)]OLU22387.1 DNA lesion error-prone repair protein ImuA [Pseudomonas sp. PA15(2017)]
MPSVVAIDHLLNERRIWRGQGIVAPSGHQPTGHAELDAALPGGGWPEAALSELLVEAPGIGELRVVLATLARLSAAGERVVLVAPPYLPYPSAWSAVGVEMKQVALIQASARDALWAAEQCLRSGSCAAVVLWPQRADDRALRRLQIAAETGQTLAFAYRPLHEARNPSPAALRLTIQAQPAQVRVLKCRGGQAPARTFQLSGWGF